jgi:hypothetical protein
MSKSIITVTVALLAAVFLTPLTAQHNWCGTTGEYARPVKEQLIANKRALREGLITSRQNTRYIPLKFHLIARTNGQDRLRLDKALDQLCAINEDFEDIGFQFYLKDGDFNYIDNNTAYENHTQVQTAILNNERDNEAVNIFVPETANFSSGGVGTVLGYFQPGFDWLVVGKNEIGASSSTLPHELGHFFSLLHPFSGWEPNAWNEEDHGNPVTQATAPDGFSDVELVNGSNCEEAGDLICDTPPNYNFGFGWPNCNFTELVYDRNSDLIEPIEELFMSYFLACSRSSYYFSDDQIDVMLADYEAPSSAYYRSDYVPNQEVIEEDAERLAPALAQNFNRYNDITFEWSSVPGAEAYLLQISVDPAFGETIVDMVVTGTSQTIELLQPSRLHFWRVRPFNEYYACTGFGGFGTFITGAVTSTQEAMLADDFSIQPNPLRAGQALTVQVSANEAFRANFTLYSMTGQAVQTLGQQSITVGDNQFDLPAQQTLPAGMYLLEMRDKQRRQFTKLVITN